MSDQFTYVPSPTITKISAGSGPARGGTKLTITGTNFLGTVSVRFGGKLATGVRVLSSSELTVTAPSGTGTQYVTVSALGGASKTTANSRYSYVLPPTITQVSPGAGANKGGTKVTIRGSNFVGPVSVRFGSKLATSVHVLSSSEITLVVPPGSGTVYVTVSAMGGSSRETVTSEYHY